MNQKNIIEKIKGTLLLKPSNEKESEEQFGYNMLWFRLISDDLPFHGLSRMVEDEDIWFDYFFFQPPLLHLNEILDGSLFWNATKLCTACFSRHVPEEIEKVHSRIHFNKNGDPDDLTLIYRVAVKALREYVLIDYLVENSKLLRAAHPDFLFCIAVLIENNFAKNPTADLDIILTAEIFLRLVCVFRHQLPVLYYRQMTGAYLYQQISERILSRMGNIKVDFSNKSDMLKNARRIEKIARQIVFDIDEMGLRNDVEGYGFEISPGATTRVPGRKLLNNRFFAFLEDSDEQVIESYTSEAEDIPFTVQIFKARNLPGRFAELQRQVAKGASGVIQEIAKLKTVKEQKRKFLNYSGTLNIARAYRKNVQDARFFIVDEKADTWENAFNVVLLIDNSCSIPPKVHTLQKALTLLVTVFSSHTDIFMSLYAYAQKGSSKTVFLTPLVEGKTHKIRNWGSLLYFNCRNANYDPFALHEVLRRNEKILNRPKEIPLVFVLGDAWPVSMESDSKSEGTKIMSALRKKYPKMVIINIATSPLYKPEELGYDYYITLTSEAFSVTDFTNQLKQVILKVISDYVFN